MAPGLDRHLAQVEQMNPKDLERRAVAMGYNDLVTSAIPMEHAAGVPPVAAAAAANGAVVEVVKKRGRKPKTVVGVPLADVATAGDVVLASVAPSMVAEASLPASSVMTVMEPSFCAFFEEYAKGKAHSKKESLYEYLQKQLAAGKRWNAETKRFVGGEKKPRAPRKKKGEE